MTRRRLFRPAVSPRVALLALAGFVLAAGAHADERSERLYSRALVELHAGRVEQARALLDEAVSADPQDAYALYYRGTIRGRQGDLTGASEDLRAALGVRPDFDQAALDLGVALLDAGDPAAAIPPLQQASRRRELEAHARLYLGIAELRAGRPDAARADLAAAIAIDPTLAPTGEYYLGLAEGRAGNTAEATRHFERSAAAAPDSATGREARAGLERLGEEGKPWNLYASAGFQYDSNLILAGDDVGVSELDDGRAVLGAGAVYAPRLSDRFSLSAGYEFFQSLHFDHQEFDLQNHRPEIRFLASWNALRFGMLARYDFYLRDGSSFLQQGTGNPWLSVEENGIGRLEVYYRVRLRDFLDDDFAVRDSVNQAPGIRQVFYLGSLERYAAVGYQFDREDPNRNTDAANRFAYDGHEVNFALGATFPFGTWAELDYAYRREQYPENSLFSPVDPRTEGRRDKVHEIALVARHPIGDYFRIVAGYFGTFNGSNSRTFDYERHIASLGVEVVL